jgi:hypothetical protein
MIEDDTCSVWPSQCWVLRRLWSRFQFAAGAIPERI